MTLCVGNEKMMKSIGAEIANCDKCNHFKGTIIYVGIDGVYAGHIIISDQIKTDSAHAITSLKEVGIEKTVMLTGDHKEVANFVSENLGINNHLRELMPADKVTYVEHLLNEKPINSALAFVGDGINDAPSLVKADVGISMQRGADIAKLSADIALLRDDIECVADAKELSNKTLALVYQNFNDIFKN